MTEYEYKKVVVEDNKELLAFKEAFMNDEDK